MTNYPTDMNCPNCQSTNEPKFSRELPMTYFCPDCGEDTEDEDSPDARTMSLVEVLELRYATVRAALEELMFLFPRPGDFGEVNDRVTAAHAAARKALTDTQP